MVSPYTIRISDHRLDAIAARVATYDWNQLPDAGGWKLGVGIDDLRRLADYWTAEYDWRAVEAHLNELPHFRTDIESECVHFVHITGEGPQPRPPVLLLHGWPGSFLEFERVWGPLAADGHDVVIPSLPGFAFSRPVTGPIGPRRAGMLMHSLMTRLFGSTAYVVQGGDWGHFVGAWMAHDNPHALLGFHTNMLDVHAADVVATTADEVEFLDRRDEIWKWESGYSWAQGTRPQTLGAALADSPIGTAAWILEKFGRWADLPVTDDGDPDIWSTFAEDELLTDIMLYVATSSVVTAAWIYHGHRLERSHRFPAGTRIRVPTGVAAFPDPVFVPPPRSFAEKSYDIVRWSEPERGGHFAALEQPEVLLADLAAFIATVT